MDLLKEKYLNLLKEGKEGKPIIKSFYPDDHVVDYIKLDCHRLHTLPKFLKPCYTNTLWLDECDSLRTLENLPETNRLMLAGLRNLESFEGIQTNHLSIDESEIKSFKGLPETLEDLELRYANATLSLQLLKAIESGEYKPKKIKKLNLAYGPSINDMDGLKLKRRIENLKGNKIIQKDTFLFINYNFEPV